ncbi:hypothetical protein [Pajaroellobacter abortibovis]|nr:hypothetical protein [Pajaroellobacter abortibovis]
MVSVLVVGWNSAAYADPEVGVQLSYVYAGDTSPVQYTQVKNGTMEWPGNIFSGRRTPYTGGVWVDGRVGWYMLGGISVGVAGGIRFQDVSSDASPMAVEQSIARWGFGVGPYARFTVPLIPLIEPYFGIGLQYVYDAQQYSAFFQSSLPAVPATWKLQHYGFGVLLSLGADVSLLNLLGVGPFFRLMPVIPLGGCVNIQGTPEERIISACQSDNKSFVQAEHYTVWSLGLGLDAVF